MNAKILLLAASCRLLDLHDSRRERGAASKIISSQVSPDSAAYYLSLGLCIIETLYVMELREGSWFKPKSRIINEVLNAYPAADEIDVEYAIRMLSSQREIHYLSDDSSSREVSTKETTNLLDRSIGDYDQYRLSGNARLLSRIGSLKNSWMYEDKDTEKIVKAIENSCFEDVPIFCMERINSLLAMSKELTKAEELAVGDEAAQSFLESYEMYRETLDLSLEAIKKAMSALSAEAVFKEKFERWQALSPGKTDLSAGNILSDLESVAQMLERVSRRITGFVVDRQKRRGAEVGVVDFRGLAESLIGQPQSIQMYETFFETAGPWGCKSDFFIPFDFTDSVDFTRKEGDVIGGREVNLEGMVEASTERLSQFLERNREWILRQLKEGPISFFDFLRMNGFQLEPGESPADFFGVYAVPDEFGRTVNIRIGTCGSSFDHSDDGVRMHGDNPYLYEEAER